MIKPLGFYVLIEMRVVDDVTEGGIILPGDMVNKEQDATDVGYVRAIGPTAYCGYPGCEEEDSGQLLKSKQRINRKTPAQLWGLEIGQQIEYRRFEGKKSVVDGYEHYRYIPDSHIIGVIDDE